MGVKALILSTLCASLAVASPARRTADSAVNTTTCNGQTFVYEQLAGYGFLPSDFRDKFGDTAGGFGSSATFDPKSWTVNAAGVYSGILYAIPDRGWNTNGTLNYQSRVQKFEITFSPNYTSTVQNPSSPNVQLQYLDSILLTDPSGSPLSGLDADVHGPYLTFPGFPELPSVTYTGDGFGLNGTGGHRISLDSEGLVLAADGSFWISDEYGPYVYHFSPTGHLLSAIRPPPAYIPLRNGSDSFSADSPPIYNPDEIIIPASNPTGRDDNQGFEGLTASPDGKTLYVLLQSALDQDGGLKSANRRNTRFLEYDISNPSNPIAKAEYAVQLPFYSNNTKVAAQSEVHYISPMQFLVLARDSNAGHGQSSSTSLYRHIDVFDISNATNTLGTTYDCFNCSIAGNSTGVLKTAVIPATYCSWLDFNVNSQLNRFGLHNGGAQNSSLLNEKWESIAMVPVNPSASLCKDGYTKSDGEYFIFSLSDNDFITQNGFMDGGKFPYADASGYSLDNQVLVFKVKVPTY
ncbi:3-phytase [Exophiala viscosa]|uniref:3-phytase n=1 Tax=Exophiala viscosa TaxID=2486360 RepID=A0AAN6DPK9_9EURO|nr:3-phytase [Exophiala viscosa]KAI1628988.1 3-phytase [Exophiala viscosa]